ncbi:MAG TPA: cation:dicarboxylase symporter family transporter [Steroidobacteraceae bacterium]|nr:cation:dicarboxylase symporter family transporter [Steroidobacteraceae bacterium]
MSAGEPVPGGLLAWWSRSSLTVRIIAGLALGVLAGLFFGEQVVALQGVARAYIGLMQMTVLPYLVVALVLGLGGLSPREALQLAKYGGLTLLVFWGLALAVVALMPLTFPEYQSAFFFSTSLLHPHEPLSLVDLYVPANPFHSLANNIVPAVTLFSGAVGVALIGVPGKARFLDSLEVLMHALGRVTRFVVELTPFGVIPIAALAAGTLSLEELARLQVYFVTFLVAALLIGAVLLPTLVATVTPMRYREVLGASSDAVLTAFVTSNVFIVLPMLAEHCEKLAARHGFDDGEAKSVPEVVVPIAFNAPTAGKLLTLLFVPFAAWLSGRPLAVAEYPGLMLAGLFSYFAKAQVALPFLMDLVEVPQDLFQLYIPTTLLNGKLDSAVGAMSLFAFSAIVTTAMAGRLQFSVGRLLRFLLGSAALVAAAVGLTSWSLSRIVDTSYTKAEVVASMHLSRSPPPTAVYSGPAPYDPYSRMDLTPLERIQARRTLRVGYQHGRLPFSFRNRQGDLVGFDIEMVNRMAEDLGVRLEFVPVQLDGFDTQLASGEIDLVPSVAYTQHWVSRVRLSVPYMDGTVGLLVQDSRRDEFANLESIQRHDRLRIGIPGRAELYDESVQALLGPTAYELVNLESWQDYFDGQHPEIDAVLGLAEAATAWSLLHPEYSVVIPLEAVIRRPLGFATALDAADFAQFVDEWIVLQQARGDVQQAYDYWILGKGAELKRPRWSIIRDVLGWTR